MMRLWCLFMALVGIWVGGAGQPGREAPYTVYLPAVHQSGPARIAWEDAQKDILNCDPDYIVIFHGYRVWLIQDGLSQETYEPYLNATIDLVRLSGCNTPIMVQ